MATYKVTVLLEMRTNADGKAVASQRIGGWSESWYFTGTREAAIKAISDGNQSLIVTRAGLLPNSGTIIGYRLQELNDQGRPLFGRTYNLTAPGSSGLSNDVPQMALLIGCPAAVGGAIKRTIYRGLPDARVEQGEYKPSEQYNDALNVHYQALANFQFRAKTRSNAKIPINSITIAGVVTTNIPHGFALGNTVQLGRVANATGSGRGGFFIVQGPITDTGFTINGWPYGASLGGYAQRYQFTFVNVVPSECYLERVVVKKVGRPFEPYVGRATRR